MNKAYVAFDDTENLYKLVDALSNLPWGDVTIVCVGTDRSTGDAFGPILGSKLREAFPTIPVIGTLDEPCHAVNLMQRLEEIDTPYVLAIDACLGEFEYVGHIIIEDGPIRPGAGVDKVLPPVGNWSIKGVVNVSGFMEYFVLQNTRLSVVMRMADVVVDVITQSINAYYTPQVEVI